MGKNKYDTLNGVYEFSDRELAEISNYLTYNDGLMGSRYTDEQKFNLALSSDIERIYGIDKDGNPYQVFQPEEGNNGPFWHHGVVKEEKLKEVLTSGRYFYFQPGKTTPIRLQKKSFSGESVQEQEEDEKEAFRKLKEFRKKKRRSEEAFRRNAEKSMYDARRVQDIRNRLYGAAFSSDMNKNYSYPEKASNVIAEKGDGTQITYPAPGEKLSGEEMTLMTLIGAANPKITADLYKKLLENRPGDAEFVPNDEYLSFNVYRELVSDTYPQNQLGMGSYKAQWIAGIRNAMREKFEAYLSPEADPKPLAENIALSIFNVGLSGVNCADLSDETQAKIRPAADLWAFLEKHQNIKEAALQYARDNGIKDQFEQGLEKCSRAGVLCDLKDKAAESETALSLYYAGTLKMENNEIEEHRFNIRKCRFINDALKNAYAVRSQEPEAEENYNALIKNDKRAENNKDRYELMLDRNMQMHREDGMVALLYNDNDNRELDNWVKRSIKYETEAQNRENEKARKENRKPKQIKEITSAQLKMAMKGTVYQRSRREGQKRVSYDVPLISSDGYEETRAEKIEREIQDRKYIADRDNDYAKKRLEETEKHAAETADYSQFEFASSVEKTGLRNICLEYRARAKDDKKLLAILKDCEKYASMDVVAGETLKHLNEISLIEKVKTNVEAYYEELDRQESENQEKFREKLKSAEKAGRRDKEIKEIDRKYTRDQNRIYEKRRIADSLNSYFNNLTDGQLIPFGKNVLEKHLDKIAEVDKTSGGYYHKTQDDVRKEERDKSYDYDSEFIYMNCSGVKMGIKTDKEGLTWKNDPKELFGAYVGDVFVGTKDVSSRPVFTHQPKMNDIRQMLLGNCYMLAVLQDAARLYPEKIREMIRDNGDGTATVRLWSKQKVKPKKAPEEEAKENPNGEAKENPNGEAKENPNGEAKKNPGGEVKEEWKWTPVYVKLDKKKVLFGGAVEAGAEDCLWATLIEHAYMYSGMHKCREFKLPPTPYNAEKAKEFLEKYKKDEAVKAEDLEIIKAECPQILKKLNEYEFCIEKWEPALSDISGGDSGDFAEACFGPDFEKVEIDIKQKSHGARAAAYQECVDMYEESLGRDDYRDYYKKRILEYFNLSEDVTVDDMAEASYNEYKESSNLDKTKFKKAFSEVYEEVISALQKQEPPEPSEDEDHVIQQYEKTPPSVSSILSKITEKWDKDEKEKPYNERFRSNAATRIANAVNNRMDMLSDFRGSYFLTYYKIKSALDKGLPVYAGTVSKGAATLQSKHAYSVLDVYQTYDKNPKFFVRVRNPWGAKWLPRGGDVTKLKVNKTDVETVDADKGIVDVELSAFTKDIDWLSYSCSENLEKESFNGIRKDYSVSSAKNSAENGTNTLTEDVYREYLKCADDIYDALENTNSFFSKDSDAYKNLFEKALQFRTETAEMYGKDMEKLAEAVEKLADAASEYTDVHLPEAEKDRTKRQKSRAKICDTIQTLYGLIKERNKDPRAAFEKKYTQAFVERYVTVYKDSMKMKELSEEDRKKPEKVNEYNQKRTNRINKRVDNLMDNSVFRSGISDLSIHQLNYPSKSRIDAAVKNFDSVMNRPYSEKRVNLKTFKVEEKSFDDMLPG